MLFLAVHFQNSTKHVSLDKLFPLLLQNIIIIKTTDSKLVKQVFKGTWVIDQDAVKDLEEEGERELVQVVDLKSKQTYSNGMFLVIGWSLKVGFQWSGFQMVGF